MAQERGQALRALQKATEQQRCTAAAVDRTDANDQVEARLDDGTVDLVAGTAWLFARAGMRQRLDVLVVDEAGQLSLANVVAIAGSADNLVLLGDPQQLTQPVKGTHPPGAGASALQHLLGGGATVPPDRGVLLDRTWRMHPEVARPVARLAYDDRLDVAPGLERQRVTSAGRLGGTGLRFVPVEHIGNAAAATEEADEVRRLVGEVLADGGWTDAHGGTRPLRPDDVLVLTPYNAQVARIRSRLRDLPGGEQVRVGNVDKFQGQEAPVVVYSLASSSLEDAPRGFAFLYSLHRLTVALSRARAVATVVCSPALLTPVVSRPEDLRLVNALCRVQEQAAPAFRSV